MANMQTTIRFPVAPKVIYKAWLSSGAHTAMTGAKARASAQKGGRFTAWDGWIQVKNLKLKPQWCIVQSWRTSEFPKGAPDSQIELCIHAAGKSGSKVVFTHSKLSPSQVKQYRRGWNAYYWKPMREYFAQKKNRRG
jgi:hypothetical protein